MLDKKGFSLIEVMISLLVMLIIFLGLLQGALVSMDSNVVNDLRDEGVDVAYMQMNTVRSTPFAALVAGPPTVGSFTKNFRNMQIQFDTTQTVSNIDSNNKQVDLTVSWSWKNQNYNFTTTTYVRNPT